MAQAITQAIVELKQGSIQEIREEDEENKSVSSSDPPIQKVQLFSNEELKRVSLGEHEKERNLPLEAESEGNRNEAESVEIVEEIPDSEVDQISFTCGTASGLVSEHDNIILLNDSQKRKDQNPLQNMFQKKSRDFNGAFVQSSPINTATLAVRNNLEIEAMNTKMFSKTLEINRIEISLNQNYNYSKGAQTSEKKETFDAKEEAIKEKTFEVGSSFNFSFRPPKQEIDQNHQNQKTKATHTNAPSNPIHKKRTPKSNHIELKYNKDAEISSIGVHKAPDQKNFANTQIFTFDENRLPNETQVKRFKQHSDSPGHQINHINVINKIEGSIINFSDREQLKSNYSNAANSINQKTLFTQYKENKASSNTSLFMSSFENRLKKGKFPTCQENAYLSGKDDVIGSVQQRKGQSMQTQPTMNSIPSDSERSNARVFGQNAHHFEANLKKTFQSNEYRSNDNLSDDNDREIEIKSLKKSKNSIYSSQYKKSRKNNKIEESMPHSLKYSSERSPKTREQIDMNWRLTDGKDSNSDNRKFSSSIQNKIAEKLEDQNTNIEGLFNKFKENNKKFFIKSKIQKEIVSSISRSKRRISKHTVMSNISQSLENSKRFSNQKEKKKKKLTKKKTSHEPTWDTKKDLLRKSRSRRDQIINPMNSPKLKRLSKRTKSKLSSSVDMKTNLNTLNFLFRTFDNSEKITSPKNKKNFTMIKNTQKKYKLRLENSDFCLKKSNLNFPFTFKALQKRRKKRSTSNKKKLKSQSSDTNLKKSQKLIKKQAKPDFSEVQSTRFINSFKRNSKQRLKKNFGFLLKVRVVKTRPRKIVGPGQVKEMLKKKEPKYFTKKYS